jgi:hypothetical protein
MEHNEPIPELLVCELCNWKGNTNGRRQHLMTEKHCLKAEMLGLRIQIEKLEMDLEMSNQYKEKYDLLKELLHAYGVNSEERQKKQPRKHKFAIPN